MTAFQLPPFLPATVAARLIHSSVARLRELAEQGCILCVGSRTPVYATDDLIMLRGGVAITAAELRDARSFYEHRLAQYRDASAKRRSSPAFNPALAAE